MRRDYLEAIIRDLRSKDTSRINDGIRKIASLSNLEGYERIEKGRRESAAPSINSLMKRLLGLCSDDDWQTRRAAIRGLGELAFLGLNMEDICMIILKLRGCLLDDDGRVRWAAVQALDRFRMFLPDEFYLDAYRRLREMYEQQEGKIRRSIGQALERMDNPHLRLLLKAEEFRGMGVTSEELMKGFELEELVRGFRGWVAEMRGDDLRRRVKMRSAPIGSDAALGEVLAGYTKNALVGMGKLIDLPKPFTGLKKRELVEKLCFHLCSLGFLRRVVGGLRPEERLALLGLMLRCGFMSCDEFTEKYGDDLEESPYWDWHPPETVMGRLKARGLIGEGSFDGCERIFIPFELRSPLQAVQMEEEAPDGSPGTWKSGIREP